MRQAAASVIPYYNFFEDQIIPVITRQKMKDLGKRRDHTVVDKGEMNTAYKDLNAELGGTYNPLKIALNVLRRIFGSSKAERAQGDLRVLQEYSGLYDNYLFANDTLKFIKEKMHNQISKKEGWLSKLGLKKSKKVTTDPLLTDMKTTFKSWLQPFEQILSGGIKGVQLYDADINFLTELRDEFQRGKHSQYLGDIAGDLDRVVQKIIAQKRKLANQTASQQQAAQNPAVQKNPAAAREQAQRLASLAA